MGIFECTAATIRFWCINNVKNYMQSITLATKVKKIFG